MKMARQKRRQLERRWRQSRLTIHRDLFKEQKRHVNQLIASAMSAHYTANITEAACDIKQLYNVVNALLIKSETGLSDCGSMDQRASKFSAFFQDKIRMIQENLTLKVEPNYVPTDNPDAVYDQMSVFVPATEDEVRRLINKSPSTSCSLSYCADLATEIIYNLSPTNNYKHCQLVYINMNCAKNNEKCARHAVAEKPSLDKDVMNNFRPISNLSFISKLTDRVVLRRLIDHVSSGNLHEKFQSAYKPNHSTETALTRIQNDILMALDNKKGVVLVLFDLSAAFDTVDHTLLLAS